MQREKKGKQSSKLNIFICGVNKICQKIEIILKAKNNNNNNKNQLKIHLGQEENFPKFNILCFFSLLFLPPSKETTLAA